MIFKELLNRSEFIKNTFTIFSGNVLAQAIPFLIEPIIARLYAPSDFAVWALYISVANLFSIVATARYEMAIMLPKAERKALNVIGLSFLISIIVSVISFIIVWIFNTQICQVLNSTQVADYLYFVPLSVLATAWYQILNYWALRNKRFRNVSVSRVSQTVSNSALNLGFGWMALKSLGLMMAYLIGQFIALFPLLFSFIKKDIVKVKQITKKEMKEVAVEYKDFPRINSIHAFSDIFQQSTTVFLLSSFFGSVIVGLHSRTMRLLLAPASVIGGAIGQVFFQKASAEYAQGNEIQSLAKKTVKTLAFIAIPVFTVVLLYGDHIFAFVLGEKWRMAGEFAQILSPWVCLSFLIAPISQIPLIVGKQASAFLLSLVGNSIILLSILYGGLIANDAKMGFYMLSALQSIFYIYLIFWYIKISSNTTQIS